MAIKHSAKNPIKLLPKIDRELKADDKENKVLSYKTLILGIIIGIFGNVIASALWEPNVSQWQLIVVLSSVVVLVVAIVFIFEQLRKFEK